jgi:hypothetical protein
VSSLEADDLPNPLDKHQEGIQHCLQLIRAESSAPVLPVTFNRSGARPQGYELNVSDDGIRITASDCLGALYGARTLRDVWEQTRPLLPRLHIADWPEYDKRGIFVESAWGSDLMSLGDWRTFIDGIAQLKLNVLALSLYGCWDLRYEGDSSEFLYVPLARFPQLVTPHSVKAGDPQTGSETMHEYLPRMFQEDFFGEVVRHAHASGLEVVPMWAGPGHSTLLPRLLPDVSALCDDGGPTGYGYCVTRPRARALLLDVFTNLIEQHLVPHGIRVLGCQADEYYPVKNLDAGEPTRVVSPYCQCTGCRGLSPGELLQQYLLLAAECLGEHGIRMLTWQDSLARENVVEEYTTRIGASSAMPPIISCWKYNDPIGNVVDTTLETWVTPTVGLVGPLFYQDTSLNIAQWARSGTLRGATGFLPYALLDPALHKSFACAADLSWNLENSGGVSGFRSRWARFVAPHQWERALLAYELGESIVGCYPLMTHLLDNLLPYFCTGPGGLTRFPGDVLSALSVPVPAMSSVLRQSRDTLREAVRQMPESRDVWGWPKPSTVWQSELARIADHIDLFLEAIRIIRHGPEWDPLEIEAALDGLTTQGLSILRRVADTKAHFQRPSVLREEWMTLKLIRPALEERLQQPTPEMPTAEPWHAWIL